jgi:hypothetical protein
MLWFPMVRLALPEYYSSNRPEDIVGYLRGSDSPATWKQMASGPKPRHQAMILGNVEPTKEQWDAAGVTQRSDETKTITLAKMQGFFVLYYGFMLAPWGAIYEEQDLKDPLTVRAFQEGCRKWQNKGRG